MVTTSAESSNSQANFWYLDLGCSNHMTCHKEWLINFDETKKSKVKFVDDSTLKVEGIRNVIVRRKNDLCAVITSVLFFPAMKCNLLSISEWVQRGFTIVMGGYNRVKLFDEDKKLILRSKISKKRHSGSIWKQWRIHNACLRWKLKMKAGCGIWSMVTWVLGVYNNLTWRKWFLDYLTSGCQKRCVKHASLEIKQENLLKHTWT